MSKKNKKGFTLIELVAVLVIMAIIALIVTPLVMNIIRKARISADKRSIDAYGRSIELAVAGYLLDTGRFPTSVDQLTIEYSGNEVVCTTTQLNSDSSVYLDGCTVAGRSVGDYTYGNLQVVTYDTYSVGDEVLYNNVDYYVIADSGVNESTVTLLKAEPLTVQEISDYKPAEAEIDTYDGYPLMQYHSSSNAYETSYVKTTIDAWKNAKASVATEARLIKIEDLLNLGYIKNSETSYSKGDNVPNWIYNSSYNYWTMSSYNNSSSAVWLIYGGGNLGDGHSDNNVYSTRNSVRPVIVLPKAAL